MKVLWRGSLAQRVRLGTGLVLFAFAGAHFLNHALGLVSLEAMVAFDAWRTAVTRSWIGGTLLALALVTHLGAALAKVAQRRTFRMPPWEWLQLGLGIAIPLLLLPHIVNTRIANLAFGVMASYPYELKKIWHDTLVNQTALLLLVWAHGCIGLHYWLRLTPNYRRVAPLLLVAATLLPTTALLGVVTQARHIAEITADPAAFAALKAETRWPDPLATGRIVAWRADAQVGFAAIAVLALLTGLGGTLWQRRAMRIPVQYVSGPLVKTSEAPTLLELSRIHQIPHVSICGGRGRCSTCRVLVFGDTAALSPPSAAEQETLRSVNAPANVRLACQTHVRAAATVMPLVRFGKDAELPVYVQADAASSAERELAVLFVDIRGFTAMTEKKLPFDVVYLLNAFLEAIGKAVYASGGWINDRAGDGVLAVFGDPDGLPGACRSALFACAGIDRAIADLNVRLESELAQPLRVAMGLHCGPHVHGPIGIGETLGMSVVGPAVNVASRLEYVAKEADVQLAVSSDVARHAGLDATGLASRSTPIRGNIQPLDVLLVTRARDLLPRFAS